MFVVIYIIHFQHPPDKCQIHIVCNEQPVYDITYTLWKLCGILSSYEELYRGKQRSAQLTSVFYFWKPIV